MKLDINSWHAKLYAWFYDENRSEHYLPKSLCTYFCKLVLATVLCAPYFLFRIRYEGEAIYKNLRKLPKERFRESHKKQNRKITNTLVIVCMIATLPLAIVEYYHPFMSKYLLFLVVGTAFITSGLLVLFTFLFCVIFFSEIVLDLKEMYSTYVKSRAKKACPSITWENKKGSD